MYDIVTNSNSKLCIQTAVLREMLGLCTAYDGEAVLTDRWSCKSTMHTLHKSGSSQKVLCRSKTGQCMAGALCRPWLNTAMTVGDLAVLPHTAYISQLNK